MTDRTALSETEIDLLFAAQGAEMEALVELARADLAYAQRRRDLLAAAERAVQARAEMFSRVVEMHGFDSEQYEPDIESQQIVAKGGALAFLGSVARQEDTEEDQERRRGAVVSVRPVGGQYAQQDE